MEHPIIRLAGYQGPGSILTSALTRLADGIHAFPEGGACETEIDVTANGESANALFASVENGSRQVCYMASGYLSARVPELGVLDLPFSVTDRAQALAALDGTAGQLLAAAVARRTDYHVLGFWDNGFRHISNSVHPIRSPHDCQGLVIRTLDNAGYRAALAALGFEPRTTDVKDLVRVVSTGEVQAQENPLTNLMSFSLWRHHPFVSLTSHYFGVLLLVCNRAWFDELTPAQKDALSSAAKEATRHQRKLAAEADALALSELRGNGVQVLAPQELDMASMRQATLPVSRSARQSLPPALLQAYLGEPA
jgi:TRAP-type C4-dicarboxylate transport system substrate-binding protein